MALLQDLREGLACDTIKDADTVVKRTVCLAAHPGRMALYPLIRLFEAKYHGKIRFARLAFLFDVLLAGVAIGLGVVAIGLAIHRPSAFADKISFSATVAPREVVSGADSTLVIRFENGTGEELRNARLTLGYPEHFVLREVEFGTASTATRTIDVGTIPPDGSGSVHVRGVMFGDVGGDQVFTSALSFSHGKKDAQETIASTHTFRPSASTLKLALALPEHILAKQAIEGSVTYKNAGPTDFPDITLLPAWPDGFVLASSSVPLGPDGFRLPGISAGSEGTLSFRGTMGDPHGDVSFSFAPSFAFGERRYRQETLTHVATVAPPPLRLTHSVDAESVRPGGAAIITVDYENVGDEPVTDVVVYAESTSPFAKSKSVFVSAARYPELARIEPGQKGSVRLEYPLLSSVSQGATSTYERIAFVTGTTAMFDMDGIARATIRGEGEVSVVMTSPVALDAFGRYATAGGDQIGRGPLPPMVGETTKYWVFWNLRGTTNELRNVRVEGTLGPGVAFTGRQTVSTNGAAWHDAATNEMVWTSDSMAPTFSPASQVVGIAFELSLVPTEDQVGTAPTLMSQIRVTATDAVTGAFVSASGATITTNLPTDPMAAGLGVVE